MIRAGFLIGFLAVEVYRRRDDLTDLWIKARKMRARQETLLHGLAAYYDFLDTLPVKGGER